MTNSACARAEISDDEAFRIQREHDQVLNAAESAGFPRNDIVRARLIGLYARHGKERVLAAITDCAEHSASSIAYLDAILRGGPKKEAAKKLTKPVNAQQYSQRDYSDAQESDEEMVQRLLAGGGGSS